MFRGLSRGSAAASEADREVHDAANQESSCKIDSKQDDERREIDAEVCRGDEPAQGVEDWLGGLMEEPDDGVKRVSIY